jgi:radical SAM protein with 4Fe4S-binding SPASM domain
MRDFPALIDIGVMGHCVHGKSGLCAKSGVQCYQNGLNRCEPNMTLENFKKIVDECKDKCFQFALGGRGDVDQHENFEDILAYCVENDIVPNFTSSGLGFTPEIVDICKKYCGAIAISQYSRLESLTPDIAVRKLSANETRKIYRSVDDIPVMFTFGNTNPNCKWDAPNYIINGKTYNWDELHHISFGDNEQDYEYIRVYNERNSNAKNGIPNYTMNAVNMLLDAKIKTNIHYVLGKNTIDEAIARLKYNGFPTGINAVIFLLHKPVGLGKSENVLTPDDPRVAEFFKMIDTQKFAFKIGFDSCTVPAILNFTANIANESIDSCEGGRYSMYITSDMKAIPCSFDNQDMRWSYDIANDTIQNAWDSTQFNDFRSHFTNSCSGCSKRHLCYGGCPIRREIVICNNENKNLV